MNDFRNKLLIDTALDLGLSYISKNIALLKKEYIFLLFFLNTVICVSILCNLFIFTLLYLFYLHYFIIIII